MSATPASPQPVSPEPASLGVRIAGRVRLVPLIAVLVGVGVCVALGVWQLKRKAWKERLIAQIAALQTAPAEPLNAVLNRVVNGRDVQFTRVQTTCPDLERTPTLRLYALMDQPGYRIITACPLQGAPFATILVDRGFVPHDDIGRVKLGAGPIAAPVIGVLRRGDPPTWLTPKHRSPDADWFGRDIPAMAARLGAPRPAPLFLMLEKPAPSGFGPTPAPVPTEISNRHLGYVITWFGLAAALIGVYVSSLVGPRRGR